MAELSIIIPIFNGAAFIDQSLGRIFDWVKQASVAVEVVVVNDGSTDATREHLLVWQEQALCRVINFEANQGKGAAIREGLRASTGDAVIFTDADLPYGVAIFGELLAASKADPIVSCFYGSRTNPKSFAEHGYGLLRQFGRSFFSTVVRQAVVGGIKDTQCGIKFLTRPLVELVLKYSTIDRFAFDIELFVIARQNKLALRDFPVVLNHRKESSVRIVTDTFLMLVDILKIRLKIWQNFYVRH